MRECTHTFTLTHMSEDHGLADGDGAIEVGKSLKLVLFILTHHIELGGGKLQLEPSEALCRNMVLVLW